MPGGVSLYKSLVQDLILTPLLRNEVGTGKRGALTSRIYLVYFYWNSSVVVDLCYRGY
ncbi:hypothetical protein ANAEL_02223 [Anaerolineales bacterium]|nr:hypothetical protein ANAEL_02223 [Anaerolineales bacterium]